MVESHRLFNCANCLRQVRICTMCDYGNVFCPQCSGEVVRLRKVREAGDRYQKTEKGRLNHKVRQQFYLQREEEKMTHQGSPKQSRELPLSVRPAAKKLVQPAGNEEVTHECEPETSTEPQGTQRPSPDGIPTGAATSIPTPKGAVQTTEGIGESMEVQLRENAAAQIAAAPRPVEPARCDFCGRLCGEFARRAPIRRRGAGTRRRRRPRHQMAHQ